MIRGSIVLVFVLLGFTAQAMAEKVTLIADTNAKSAYPKRRASANIHQAYLGLRRWGCTPPLYLAHRPCLKSMKLGLCRFTAQK